MRLKDVGSVLCAPVSYRYTCFIKSVAEPELNETQALSGELSLGDKPPAVGSARVEGDGWGF